jgi:hypothetical protein
MDKPERKDTAQRALVYVGVAVGALGVAVATPLAAAVMVAISMLYVQDVLGDKSRGIT